MSLFFNRRIYFSHKSVFLFFIFCFHSALGQNQLEASALQLKKLILRHCSNCHVGQGDEVSTYGDFTKSGVLQFQDQLSPRILYSQINSGDMPRSLYGDALTEAERLNFLEVIEQWYSDGLPELEVINQVEEVSPKKVLSLINSDLKKVAKIDRKYLRYFSFVHLNNNSLKNQQLSQAGQALKKLLNSLSWEKAIVAPRDIEGKGSVFAISIKDFGWSIEQWENVLLNSQYPYGREYGVDLTRFNKIKKDIRSDNPIIRGDWFIANGSRPPIYHDLLKLPSHLDDLEKTLGVDRNNNIENLSVARSGFSDSGVSQHNRIIERHASDYGAYWISYDFENNLGQQNIFQSPLGPALNQSPFDALTFNHAGGEVIFNLPNGLQAYLLVDAKGNRIDKAPLEIVSDPSQPDRAVVNGVSCMGCHNRGMIKKTDQIRSGFLAGLYDNFTPSDQKAIDKLYPDSSVLEVFFDGDRLRFLSAQSKVGVSQVSPEVIHSSDKEYGLHMNYQQISYELGVSPEALDRLMGSQDFLTIYPEAFQIFNQIKFSNLKRDFFENNQFLLQSSLNDNFGDIFKNQIVTGNGHSCALIKRELRCWGKNTQGQVEVPTDLGRVFQITSGGRHTCALALSGPTCWGDNSSQQLQIPLSVKEDVTYISAGLAHTCSVARGKVQCWGSNDFGQTSIPDNLLRINEVKSGAFFSCARDYEGLKCWGKNTESLLEIPEDLGFVSYFSLGAEHICVIDDQENLSCWGDNKHGQIDVPSSLNSVSHVSSGMSHTCAVSKGEVFCWGSNEFGQVDVPKNLPRVLRVAAGGAHSCALLLNSKILCWGNNSFGQLETPKD